MKNVLRLFFSVVVGLHLVANAYSSSLDEQLVTAIQSGDLDQLVALLDPDVDIDKSIDKEGTLLQISSKAGQLAIAQHLVAQNASVNAVNDQEKRSPLQIAVELQDVALVNFLISNYANPNSMDKRGRTPLFQAIKADSSELRQLLIANGADVNIRDGKGWTPYLFAIVNRNKSALNELTANGAIIDQSTAKTLAEKGFCGQCHSDKGPGITRAKHAPHLASQYAEYTAKQLDDYRIGNRENSRMTDQVKYLGDELIQELALYYEKLPRAESQSQADQDTLDRGKTLFLESCSTCHGVDGVATMNTLTPALSALNALYTSNQLTDFRNGTRANDPGQEMRQVTKNLTDEQISDLAEYIQSL